MATFYNEKIYLQEVLNAFTAGMAPVSAFSRSFSAATARKGDAIIVPRVSAMSTTTFNYDNNGGFPYEGSGGEVVAITLNIDKHQIVPCDVTDIQSVNSSVADVTTFARQQGAALARKCLTDIFGLLSITNFGAAAATPVSIANTGIQQLRDARTALVNRRVPLDNINLVSSAELFNSLLGDSNVTNAMNFGGSEAIREARIPRLLGMDVYETNALPLGGTLSLIGFLAHQDAMGVAVRTLMPQSSAPYESVEVVTDPETGLSFTYRRHFNPGRGKMFANVECLFGFTTALTLGIGLLRRAD
jgi:hypothetical protein